MCGANPLRMWCTHWSSSHYMLFLWFQDAESLTMKHQVTIQSELLITKYFHTNEVMMYSINSWHNGNCTFGNEAKQAWRTQINHTNGYHRAPSHLPLLHLCPSHLCPSFEVPLAIRWWQVDYSRSSSPWKYDTVSQDHKPTTWWQINTRVLLPWTGHESALRLPLPAMVLCSAALSKCVQNVRFIVMRSCRMMPQTKEDGEKEATTGPWSQHLLVVPYTLNTLAVSFLEHWTDFPKAWLRHQLDDDILLSGVVHQDGVYILD